MHVEKRIPVDADLVVNAEIIISPGSFTPTCLITSHFAFVSALGNLFPPNTGSGFNLFRETYHPAVSGHGFPVPEAPAVTLFAGASLERGDVPPPGSEPGSGGVTLLGP